MERQVQPPAPWSGVHGIWIRAVVLVRTHVSGVVVDVLWMRRLADLIKCVNQGILTVGLERNVKVDCGAGRRVAQALPVLRDGAPRVFDVHVALRW